jgi:site-specific DNA-methyltransferase (adenine-specific)
MKYQILHGDNRETLRTIADNSIDAIVTDPPYGIDFLGKDWDVNTGAVETYAECLRVLKPGGHVLAFSAARTYHHLAVTLEAAGFEIRDQIMWIYSSGFPKSQDIGKSIARSEKKVKNTKTYLPEIDDNRNVANSTTGSPRCQMCDKSTGPIWKKCPDDRADCIKPWQADLQDNEWNGWGTQLKPAHEPIALARKPIRLSIARNCQTHGVGALNIDATRIAATDLKSGVMGTTAHDNYNAEKNADQGLREGEQLPWIPSDAGRFPSNVLGDIPDYQKYFYCPKVSRAERHVGFDESMSEKKMLEIMGGHYTDPNEGGKSIWLPDKGVIYAHGLKHEYSEWCKKNNIDLGNVGNNHPTVKPIELMKYLIKLITPPGGTVLDPFNGSGSTGCAAVELGMTYVGCELDQRYVEIADKRIRAWYEHCNPNTFNQLFEQD